MTSPRVTVCMPVYQNAKFLPEAIESILQQTFTDFELLIDDDCSTDASQEVISHYASLDDRIVACFNNTNKGMVTNWNACLEKARGEYVKFLFGDDILASKEALSRMVAILDSERSASLVACARNIIDVDSNIIKVASSFPDGVIKKGTEIIYNCLLTQKNLIGEPSVVMFRKKDAFRFFDARYSQLVDLEMWFHLLEQGEFSFIGDPLASFRVHADQQTKENVRNLVHVDEMLDLLDEYGAKPYVTLGRMPRKFLLYNQQYRIWKAYKNKMISRGTALAKISHHCPPWKFLALVPVYKILSPIWKILKTVCLKKLHLKL
ncbi:glycosyltransferase [Geotalea sp. SG265]|uniref:glycosyltransferase family 2 protein n=1 Tax=Geotalea sp. SG265 TaxID=2922867 RepID=UPI001FB00085|nr:glycosyltransferase [Geotalea sp. SG265]